MASSTPICEDDLFCPQCSDIYCFPVILKCGHNVCKVCLQKFWEWKKCRECPVCRTVSIPTRPPINLPLKIAADEYQRQLIGRNPEVCFIHKETLSLFCENDEKLICSTCQTSTRHKIHDCCPVEEAAQQKKTEVSTMLESLRKKLKTLSKTEESWREMKAHIQNQANQNEKEMKLEFQKLHKFLWEEEKSRRQALRQEEEVKTQVMCKKLEHIKDQMKRLSSTISDIETVLKENNISFLQEYKKTKKRVKCDIREPECLRDILLDSAKHLGQLKFAVWQKMATIIDYVPITLDPNTAHFNLQFSRELTCVRYSRKQLLPDNTERCTSRLCVMGASGFTSGKHSWTVEVGQSNEWCIGVARESAKRKSTVFLIPAEGFWTIGQTNGHALHAQTSPRTKLLLKKRPARITVELDCDKGRVVFINADDSTMMYTFKDRFTEKIFPYVSLGLSDEGNFSIPLTICTQNINVNVDVE